MTCPRCGMDFEPSIDIRGLTVHPACGASIVIATGEGATSAETMTLSPEELRQLRAARQRPKRQPV